MRRFFILVLCIAAFAGCKKELSEISSEKLTIPPAFASLTFRDIVVMPGNVVVVSGGDNGVGVILKSTDGGQTWVASENAFDNQINCLYFMNPDVGYCADSDILIYKTVNGGKNWNYFAASSWPLTVNRFLRDIWFTSDSTGFVCGGKNFGNGVLFTTTNSGEYWSFREYAHEYRGIAFKDKLDGVMCGYGSLLHTTDGAKTFSIIDNGTKFYTGICTDIHDYYWMCDFNGGIYKSSDGSSWKSKRDNNSLNSASHQQNCIAVSNGGNIACAGPGGYITWSRDDGNTWTDRTSFDGNEIHSIKWLNEFKVIAAGKKGVYTLSLQ